MERLSSRSWPVGTLFKSSVHRYYTTEKLSRRFYNNFHFLYKCYNAKLQSWSFNDENIECMAAVIIDHNLTHAEFTFNHNVRNKLAWYRHALVVIQLIVNETKQTCEINFVECLKCFFKKKYINCLWFLSIMQFFNNKIIYTGMNWQSSHNDTIVSDWGVLKVRVLVIDHVLAYCWPPTRFNR